METPPEPKELLRKARENKGWTQQEMAEKLGLGLRMYQRIEIEGQFPKYKTEQVAKIDELLGTKLYDLIYEQTVSRETSVQESFIESRRAKKLNSGPLMVPFIPIKAQAGYTKITDQMAFIQELEKFPMLPGIDPTGADWRYWEIEGDSMEPELSDGDQVLTNQVHPRDWDHIRNFYVHVIVTNERVLIKRVVCKSPLEWVLISANETNYDQLVIPVESVREVWYVRRVIKYNLAPAKMYEVKK